MTDQRVERGKPADYGQEILRRRTRITTSFLPLEGLSVLDFGAGNGAQTLELVKQGCRIVACDIDAADLNVLKHYTDDHHLEAITPVLYDGRSLPLAAGQFDAVVSYAVLEHVVDEPAALDEIYRVLKPGGSLVISVPNKWWVFETHGARLPLLPWNRVPFFSWLPAPVHRRFAKARIYRRADICRILTQHGLDILQTALMTAPMDVVKSPKLKVLLRKFIFKGDLTPVPFLATEVFVHARKPRKS